MDKLPENASASRQPYCDFAMIPYALFGRVSPAALGVFAGFAKFADFRTGVTFASVDTVASLLGIERRSVMRAIRELTKAEALKTKRQGLGKPAIRTLQMPPIKVRPESAKEVPLSEPIIRESALDSRIFCNVVDFKKASA